MRVASALLRPRPALVASTLALPAAAAPVAASASVRLFSSSRSSSNGATDSSMSWSASAAAAAAASAAAHRHLAHVARMHAYHQAVQTSPGAGPQCMVASGHALELELEGAVQPSIAMAALPRDLAHELAYDHALASMSSSLSSSFTAQEEAALAELLVSAPSRRFIARRRPEGLLADSVKRKRTKKMNKHKYKKRLKEQRRQSRKNSAQ
jgi:hypothetical protein